MVGFVVFALVLCAYGWTASPVIGWLDSPELVAASASLGVAHSPGHPIPLLLGRLATLFPLGDAAFRVNLASAVAGAFAAWAVYLSCVELLRQTSPKLSNVGRLTLSAGVALGFAACAAAWLQGVRAEVYAIHVALTAGSLAALFRYHRVGDGRWLVLAGLLAGLELANHHLMAILFIVPAAVFVLARRRPARPAAPAIAATAVAGLLGLAALLYLPVRSAQHPEPNWAAPHTIDRFVWTVSAKAFQKSTQREHATSRGQAARQATWAAIENTGELMVLAALIALAVAFVRRQQRDVMTLLAAIAVLAIAGRAAVGFDPTVPDHLAYLLPAILALALLGAAGVAAIAEWLPLAAGERTVARVKLVILAVPLAAATLQVARDDSGRAQRAGYAAAELADWELAELPPRSVVLLAYFQTSFRVAALRAAYHARPDIAVLDRGLTYPGAATEARRRHPELSPLIDAGINVKQPLPTAELQALARRRPVFVQLDPLGRAMPWAHLAPQGPFARYFAEPLVAVARRTAEVEDAAARLSVARRLAAVNGGERRQVIEALVWHDFLRLLFYCGAGRTAAAQLALDSAAELVGADEELERQAKRCGLVMPAHRR